MLIGLLFLICSINAGQCLTPMRRASLSGVMELIDYMVGVYSAHVKSPAAGEYDVAFLLGAPAVNECFHLKAALNPSRARSIQTAVIDYLDAPNRAAARETFAGVFGSTTRKAVDAPAKSCRHARCRHDLR